MVPIEVAVYSRSYKLDQQTLQFSGELRRTRDAKTVCIFLRSITSLGTQADQAKGWGNVALYLKFFLVGRSSRNRRLSCCKVLD